MIKALSSAVAGLTLLAGAVSAQPFEAKGSAGGWNVFLNQATQGCFIERQTPQEVVLQIGTEAAMMDISENPFGFLSVYIPGEAPAGANPNELVVVTIGPNTYIGVAATVQREGFHGGVVVSNDDTLGFDLRNRRSMNIAVSNGAQVTVDLLASDVNAALDALVACQKAVSG